MAVSNQRAQLDELKKHLEQQYPVTVSLLDIDLSQDGSADQVFDYCRKQHFEIEVLVNNAGMLVFSNIVQIDYSRMNAILVLHMVTPALLCRLFAEEMVMKRKGFILNVASISAVMPYPGISLYGPTKAFVWNYTRAFRTEMKYKGVKVTCLVPGATATALYDTQHINISFLMKLGIFKKPHAVAQAGMKALFKGREVCIPGFMNKLIVRLFPLIPRGLIDLIYRKTNLVKSR